MFFEIKKEYTGIVDVTKDGNTLFANFPDGSTEPILCNTHEYDRFFSVLGTLLGFVRTMDEKRVLYLSPYVMLHNHSEYSLLDGMSRAKGIAKRLSDGGYTPFFALTDHGSASGLPSFDATLTKAGLCPINGIEVYVEALDGEKKNCHLILLAKNETGYKNLSHIVTESQTNFYRHANATVDIIRAHSEGLVCMTACLAGELAQAILNGDEAHVEKFIETYHGIFGEDFYLEIQRHGLEDEEKVIQGIIRLSRKYRIKTVATTDSHYIDKDDAYAHEVLLAIGTQDVMSNPDRYTFDGTGYHILNANEFYDLFEMYPNAIRNGFEVARKCAFHFKKKEIEMPYFDIPKPYSEAEYFDWLAKTGFERRFGGTQHELEAKYLDRLAYELSIIHQMKFEGYFLIVADFIGWAKEHDIAVGPGRGSAVGSLVAYCLGITDLDPLPYDLLFERFLNPERVTMPDIDIDLSDERRQEVIDYVVQKYGKDHVSRIITFGTEAAKNSIRDVARVLEVPLETVNRTLKFVPNEPHMTIDKALETSPDFYDIYMRDDDMHRVIDIAKRIEGVARNKSQHACGVVIAKNPIADSIPEEIMSDQNGNDSYTAAFQKEEVEDNGCIKFDFLGLRNMSILQNASKDVGLDYQKLPLFDPETYAFIASGDTEGIFQIESSGMKSLVCQMFSDVRKRIDSAKTQNELDAIGHECFERLIAAIALYRPGPIDYIPEYIDNMKHKSSIRYALPQLEPILKTTYNVICYQEQVQQICRDLAGYSLGRADLIRRGMAKKKKEIIDAEREVFLFGNKKAFDAGVESVYVPGCKGNGIPEDVALDIWSKMEKFAAYSFNKSHAAAYAVISVRTAWLKKYHPVAFWCETLNSVMLKSDQLRKYIRCAKQSGVEVLPPTVNDSSMPFTIDGKGNAIRMGLGSLQGLGKVIQSVLEEREKNGKYDTYQAFVDRCRPGKKLIQALGYSGALDVFGYGRRTLVEGFPDVKKHLDRIKRREKSLAEGKKVRGDALSFEPELLSEYPKQETLKHEYEVAGMYISEHPLDEYKSAIDSQPHMTVDEVKCKTEFASKNDVVFGVIRNLENKNTKSGKRILCGKIEDQTGIMEFIVFSDTFEQRAFRRELLIEDAIVRLEGQIKVNDAGTGHTMMVRMIDGLTVKQDKTVYKVVLRVDQEHMQKLLDVVKQSRPGNYMLQIGFECGNEKKSLEMVSIEKEFFQIVPIGESGSIDNELLSGSLYGIAGEYLSKIKELSKYFTIARLSGGN